MQFAQNSHYLVNIIQTHLNSSMEDSKHILIPAKFIALVLHLIATTMLYFGYKDNVISAYPALASSTDSLYVGGKTSFLAANTLTIIGIAVEFIIMFIGVNLFKERLTVLVSTFHFIGCILYSSYGYGQWQFSSIWALWAVFSFFPLMIELIGACHPSNK